MFYEQTEEIIELDKSFEKIENAKKSIDFNLREKSKGLRNRMHCTTKSGLIPPEVHFNRPEVELQFFPSKSGCWCFMPLSSLKLPFHLGPTQSALNQFLWKQLKV